MLKIPAMSEEVMPLTVPVNVGLAFGASRASAVSARDVSVATAIVAKDSAFDCAVAAAPAASAPTMVYVMPLTVPVNVGLAVGAAPRAVRAAEADVAPVPPFATAMVVPFHVPVVIVPRVVTELEPAYVAHAGSPETTVSS